MTFEAYESSYAQRRLYLVNRLLGDGSNIQYNISAAWELEGPLDVDRLQYSFDQMLERHESFRTTFTLNDEQVLQVVHEEFEFKLQCIENPDKTIDSLVDEFIRPFKLDTLPLWRAKVILPDSGKKVILFDIHHIIADGLSMDVFIRDLMAFYKGEDPEPLEFQYVDFTMWQNDFFTGERMAKLEGYWLEKLSGDIPQLELFTDFPRPKGTSSPAGVVEIKTGPPLMKAVAQAALATQSTQFTFFTAVFQVFLHLYSGQEDIFIGSPVAGRSLGEFKNIIGMFVNTLVLRDQPRPGISFQQFLKEVNTTVLNALEHQDFQFEMLVEKLPIRRQQDRNPLFDVMFTLLNKSANLPETGKIQKTIRSIPIAKME
ncbi:MAG: non-ribosomal peptide synthetase, partial [bacterium]|nr:non-ribosomal peptide synthetase [bacterium]